MKIRKPWMIKSLCLLGYGLARLLLAAVPNRYFPLEKNYSPNDQPSDARFIYVIWHEYLMVPLFKFGTTRTRLLTSSHADGQIVAEITKRRRMGTVDGSSKHGGMEAVRKLLRPSRYRFLAITVDGPQGPRRVAKKGAVYLASKTGWPIVSVGVGCHRPWRCKSWDRMAVPKPGNRTVIVTGKPVVVPPGANAQELELARQLVENQLHELTAIAEHLAETGQRVAAVPTSQERAAA
jgi:lysophospholipid acyltransferase (LPLAT)-like uncharacterized protein